MSGANEVDRDQQKTATKVAILSLRLLSGPNVYSLSPVLKTFLDIGIYETIASNAIEGFIDRLLSLLPGLANHQCSLGRPGGFVERLREGTYLAHIFEHVSLELQTLAGLQVSFGKTRRYGPPGVYTVITGYRISEVGVEAARGAEKLLNAVLSGAEFSLQSLMDGIHSVSSQFQLGPSTEALYQEACQRGIPVVRGPESGLLTLGYGVKQEKIWATITSRTSSAAVDIACDKFLTKQILADNQIPAPYGLVVTEAAAARKALDAIGGPLAVKPVNGNQGKGVSLRLSTAAEVERAFFLAVQYDRRVLVEEWVPGLQYRLCVVNGKMAACAQRIPAYVQGDGRRTVAELVTQVNADPRRGLGHEKQLTRMRIDPVAVAVLARQGFDIHSIPAENQTVFIRENANLSTGGTAVDATDMVHPEVADMVERAVRLIGLDVAGVDVVARDIGLPPTDGAAAIIEINAAPGIRMHHYPAAGKARNVAGAVLNYLYPAGENGRIPLAAITGTNGKTTVTRLISHIYRLAGKTTGMTSSDGIYIGGKRVLAGDTTGPDSARLVLRDPSVEAAVLEVARGGIIRGGLGYDRAQVAVITNISEDHIGQDGVDDLQDLAYVKSLVAEAVLPDGKVLLNADDSYVARIAKRARGQVVYFSVEPDNILVRRHLGVGGQAFFVRNGMIVAAEGSRARELIPVVDAPLTLGGIARHNVQNVLVAAAACVVGGLADEVVKRGLVTFEENPGRLAFRDMGHFRVCVDYGHNPAGYQALISTVRRLGAKRLVGVIGVPGDRRDDTIRQAGKIAGQGFDYLYIKEDNDLRGRQPGETAALLGQGAREAGAAAEKMTIILSEREAVSAALGNACPGDLIVVFYENLRGVTAVLDDYRSEQSQFGQNEDSGQSAQESRDLPLPPSFAPPETYRERLHVT